jgi:PST family polysaccharide transporter
MSNFFSLSVLQGANYILPLITLPYLVRVLGVEYFGLLAFAGATVMYFQILTDYGFNLTATREISIHRDNKAKVIEIFSSVMSIKVILMFVSFLLLTILVFSFEKFSKDALVYFLTFGTVVGQVLFPVWFFQGMERMKYITYLNILSKVIFTIAIFAFVQEQSDFYLVPLLTSVGFLVAGIWSLYLVKKEFEVRFELQTINTIKHHFFEGWYVFLSQLKISLFSTTNIIILGLITNNTVVGYYSVAEKIMRALAMMQSPILGALFPHMSKIILKQKAKAVSQLKKVIFFGSIIYAIVLSTVFVFSESIISLLFGDSTKESIVILQIMSIIPLTIFLNNIFGTQILLNTKKEKIFFLILLTAGISNLILCSLLTYFYGAIGTSVAMLIIEIGIMLAMYYFAKDFLNDSKD